MKLLTPILFFITICSLSTNVFAIPQTITQTLAYSPTPFTASCTTSFGNIELEPERCGVSEGNQGLYRFQRFNASVGTLTKVTLVNRWDIEGIFILRPEDSFLSTGADGGYSVTLNTYLDEVGNNDGTVFADRGPSFFYQGEDLVDQQRQTGEINDAKRESEAIGWRLNGNNAFVYEGDVLENFTNINVPSSRPVSVWKHLGIGASVSGQGADCNGADACGATNRIREIKNSFTRLIYEYLPVTDPGPGPGPGPGPTVDVPEPSSVALLSLGFIGLVWSRRKSKV